MIRQHQVKYLLLSLFGGDAKRHGGTRRSDQLVELVLSLGGEAVTPETSVRCGMAHARRNPMILAESLWLGIGFVLSWGLSLKGLVKFALGSLDALRILNTASYDCVLLETGPSLSIYLMRVMATRRIPFIALPHNIEYLVASAEAPLARTAAHLFQVEVAGYRASIKTLAISQFDRATLRCSGVTAKVLSYWPVAADVARFAAIDEERARTPRSPALLLLGTVDNEPTYDGMVDLLQRLQRSPGGCDVVVVGYGTERLKALESGTVKVIGAVDDEVLAGYLKVVRAALVNQPQTSGFLTRLVEMNLCGVPQFVVSDYYQAAGLERFGIVRVPIDRVGETIAPDRFDRFAPPSSDEVLQLLATADVLSASTKPGQAP